MGISVLGITSWGQLKDAKISLPKVDFLLLSGTWEESHMVWLEQGKRTLVLLALDVGSRPKDGLQEKWKYLRHKDCDGVTSGGWWCGNSQGFRALGPAVAAVRRLSHIISPTSPGKAYITSEDREKSGGHVKWEGSFCHSQGLLPITRLGAMVICTSVYSGQLVRHLTVSELLDALDVPQADKELFKGVSLAGFLSTIVAKGAPARVLGRLLEGTHMIRQQNRSLSRPKPDAEVPTHEGGLPKVGYPCTKTSTIDLGRQKAAKDDNAQVAFEFWDGPFLDWLLKLGRSSEFVSNLTSFRVGAKQTLILDVLRDFILRVWRRKVLVGFLAYMVRRHGRSWATSEHPDVPAGRDCLRRVTGATFWDWAAGSRLFFWRWPLEVQEWARDGHPVYIQGELPSYRRPQPAERNEKIKGQVKGKLEKFTQCEYVMHGAVTSLISYFSVPKGDSDIRLVLDGTKSGLNSALWAPSFHLPTVDSLLPALQPGSWQGDIDIGEMFYNYGLHPSLQAYCGLDVQEYGLLDLKDYHG